MKVIKSEFDFTYQRRKYHAQVHRFTPDTIPMVRVWLLLKDQKEKVFVFYQKKPDELFWYDLPDPWDQGMAKTIANTLLI